MDRIGIGVYQKLKCRKVQRILAGGYAVLAVGVMVADHKLE